MRPDDLVRLRHVADALTAAANFAHGRDRRDLDTDQMFLFALVHAIQIVGEAASKVSVDTRMLHPAIPWTEITSMRDRLVHAYFDVNHDILWATVTDAVPALLADIRNILATA